MKPKLISVADFCVMLGVGRTKAYQLLNFYEPLGEVETTKIGRRRLIVRSSAEKLIKRSIEKGEM